MNQEQSYEKAQGIGIVNLLAGIWLIFSPLLLGYPANAIANSILAGIALSILATVRLTITKAAWTGWAVVAVGAWLIIAPFIFGFTTPTVLWNEIIVGIIIAGLNLWRGTATAPLSPTRQHPTM